MNRLHELIRLSSELGEIARKRVAGTATFAELKEEWRLSSARHDLAGKLLAEFVVLNGMKVSSPFSPRSLAEERRADGFTKNSFGYVQWHNDENPRSMGLDHHHFMKKVGRAAAILTQPYAPHWANHGGHPLVSPLRKNTPPNPWAAIHNPGVCLFIVLTRTDFPPIRWLPDQLEFEVENTATSRAGAIASVSAHEKEPPPVDADGG